MCISYSQIQRTLEQCRGWGTDSLHSQKYSNNFIVSLLVPHPWIHPTQDPVVLYYIFIGEKKIHISGPEQFKPMMPNGQLYFAILFL